MIITILTLFGLGGPSGDHIVAMASLWEMAAELILLPFVVIDIMNFVVKFM